MERVWWVNQPRTYAIEIRKHGKVAAVTRSRNGSKLEHHENVMKMSQGDIVLSNVHGKIISVGRVTSEPNIDPKHLWEGEDPTRARPAYVVHVDYFPLDPPIPTKEIREDIYRLNLQGGPINSLYNVRQGYAFFFDWDGLNIIRRSQLQTQWPDLEDHD